MRFQVLTAVTMKKTHNLLLTSPICALCFVNCIRLDFLSLIIGVFGEESKLRRWPLYKKERSSCWKWSEGTWAHWFGLNDVWDKQQERSFISEFCIKASEKLLWLATLLISLKSMRRPYMCSVTVSQSVQAEEGVCLVYCGLMLTCRISSFEELYSL